MSCAPTPCPPTSAPDPETRFTQDLPPSYDCGRGDGVFYNTPQTYVNSCSLGSPTPPISVTIPAFTYSSTISQGDADDQAMAAAQSIADTERVLSPCEGVEGDFLITEDGDFLITPDEFLIT